MDPITPGSTGAAVEDIQERLVRLDYVIDDSEREKNTYGPSTAKAVARFRLDHDLSLGEDVDTATWMLLVDESYQLGDRTLYLRLPNFHGNDVRQLQERLNILGFSCGKPDGQYGVHTEAAVKLFQESVGELADGMEEVGADTVVLVDVRDAGHAVAVGLAPDGLGLGLNAGDRVEDGDGAIEHAQGALDFGGEVDVARGHTWNPSTLGG